VKVTKQSAREFIEFAETERNRKRNQEGSPGGGNCEARDAACAAAFFRDTSAGGRDGYPDGAGSARAFECEDDANLHACDGAAGVGRSESAGWGLICGAGSGMCGVSQSQRAVVESYIRNQEEHHLTKSFKEEFLELLQKHGVEYDERYLWD